MSGNGGYDEASTRRAMGWTGLAFVTFGLLGYLLYPRLVIAWIVLAVFGIAVVPRIVVSKIREARAESEQATARSRRPGNG